MYSVRICVSVFDISVYNHVVIGSEATAEARGDSLHGEFLVVRDLTLSSANPETSFLFLRRICPSPPSFPSVASNSELDSSPRGRLAPTSEGMTPE